jgi:hypothetical protein
MHVSTGFVSVTKAAELLSAAGDHVDRTSLSRYVKSHADALRPERQGRETIVDYEALAAHRRENIRLSDAKPFADDRSKADEAKGKLRVDRQLRELDLAERQGALTIVTEVEAAARDAVSAMSNAFALAVNEVAEKFAASLGTEARLVRPHLRDLEKKAIDNFARSLADSLLVDLA